MFVLFFRFGYLQTDVHLRNETDKLFPYTCGFRNQEKYPRISGGQLCTALRKLVWRPFFSIQSRFFTRIQMRWEEGTVQLQPMSIVHQLRPPCRSYGKMEDSELKNNNRKE